jgi:peptide chain release factor 1
MDEKILKSEKRYQELEQLLADPAILNNQEEYQKLAKEYADLTGLVTSSRELDNVRRQMVDLKKLVASPGPDRDFYELAKEELETLKQTEKELNERVEEFFNPKRRHSNRNIIVEIRAGTGGDEASLFAADLYRMYTRYAVQEGWKVEPMSGHTSDTKGFKEVIFSISGAGAEDHLRWENGAHRVQRVPETEASGRIHTSAATVCVMAEPEEVEININPSDLRIDVFRSSGAGGQSVNTADSAVRITHLPTGLVVTCQDERSQLKNKNKAMRVLRARLSDKFQQEKFEKEAKDRKLKVGSGDRSEKIRTYNYPERRVTDHRIGLTLYKLDQIMNGDLEELTDALMRYSQEESKE